MDTTIQKWGNDYGLCIPQSMMDALSLRENDVVSLVRVGDTIVVKKPSSHAHMTLEERLVAFYGVPIDQIKPPETKELDW